MRFKSLYCENAYLQNVEALKWPVIICDIVVVHTTHSKMNTYILYKYTPPPAPPYTYIVQPSQPLQSCGRAYAHSDQTKTHWYHRTTACNH